ncbi:MAG: c-type cytochrome biogenesis protein CcmI [Pseudomonadales bacterium]
MTSFWFLAALLALAALVFLWWPIVMQRRHRQLISTSRQDLNVQAFESQSEDLQVELQAGRLEQSQYDALYTELQRNLLGDVPAQAIAMQSAAPSKGVPFTAILLSLMVLFGGLALYLNQGSSQILQQIETKQAFAQQLTTASPDQRLALLEAKAQENPDDADSWYALANVYFQQQHFEQSTAAYERLLSLVGDQPGLLAEYAQALFFIKGNRVTAEVKELAERILRVQPGNVSALGLLGIEAFENKQYARAIGAWESALDVAPDAQGSNALRQGITRAQQLLAEAPQKTEAQEVQQQVAQSARLTLQVSIDEKLLSQLDPELMVFVLARAINGPRIPLAVERLKVKDLPVEVILSDDMAMTPNFKLSSVEEVEVLARVSFSGQPLPQKGDLQGSFRPVNVSDQQVPIKLLIDQIIQ